MIEEGQCAALTGGVVLGREIVPRVPARAQREKPKRRVGAKTQSWRQNAELARPVARHVEAKCGANAATTRHHANT
jgi:hypothetical protein